MGVASLRSISVNSRMEADFNFMYLMKPAKMKIRRNFNTGVWAQFKCSSHSLQFHLKVSRIARLSDCLAYCLYYFTPAVSKLKGDAQTDSVTR